jgi:hypothetical protein
VAPGNDASPRSPQELHLLLCRDLLADLAPAETMLAPAAVDEFRRDPDRYRDNPGRLTSAGGGDLGGAGIGEAVQFMLPYVTALAGFGLQLIVQTAQQVAVDAAAGGVVGLFRRRRKASAAAPEPGPLTAVQLEQLEQMINSYGEKWRLTPADLSKMKTAVLNRFTALFGRAT